MSKLFVPLISQKSSKEIVVSILNQAVINGSESLYTVSREMEYKIISGRSLKWFNSSTNSLTNLIP